MTQADRNRMARRGIQLLTVLLIAIFMAPFLIVGSGVNLGAPNPRIIKRAHCIAFPDSCHRQIIREVHRIHRMH